MKPTLPLPSSQSSLSWGAILALAARLAVGVTMVISGVHKAAAPATEFAVVIEAYQILPDTMILPVATLLPWIEAWVGLALALGYWTRAMSLCAGAMLTMFITALGSTVARHIALDNCGCFGGGIHLTPLQAIALDSSLLILCWISFCKGRKLASLDNWIEKGK